MLKSRFNANTAELICMQISTNIVNGPKELLWEPKRFSADRMHGFTDSTPMVNNFLFHIFQKKLYTTREEVFCSSSQVFICLKNCTCGLSNRVLRGNGWVQREQFTHGVAIDSPLVQSSRVAHGASKQRCAPQTSRETKGVQ